MSRLSREQAITEMVNGGLLYVYVENENRVLTEPKHPAPGSGAIVGDHGLSHVGQRTVRAIERLGTRWCYDNRALVLTDDGRDRAAGRVGALWMWR